MAAGYQSVTVSDSRSAFVHFSVRSFVDSGVRRQGMTVVATRPYGHDDAGVSGFRL